MGMTLELHPSDRHNKAAMALAGGGGGTGGRCSRGWGGAGGIELQAGQLVH